MTDRGSTPTSARVVVAGEADGVEVVRFGLDHGQDPEAGLAIRGWRALRPSTAQSTDQPRWTVVVTYAVGPGDVAPATAEPTTPADDDLTEAEVAAAVPHQRVAAYGFVTSGRGLLLTELSPRTNAAGRWNLPGGGLDPGEDVVAALEREIWEETDQRVDGIELVAVQSVHWVGRAPRGVVEDYHSIRLFHTATCPEPTDPHINDVGGSTSAAEWVPLDETGRVPFVDSLTPLIGELIGRHPARD